MCEFLGQIASRGVTRTSLTSREPAPSAGNANYLAAQHVTMTFTVTLVFVLRVKPATITTAPPDNNPEALMLSLVNGFNGPVKLNCTLP
jgi:hypothetical protein